MHTHTHYLYNKLVDDNDDRRAKKKQATIFNRKKHIKLAATLPAGKTNENHSRKLTHCRSRRVVTGKWIRRACWIDQLLRKLLLLVSDRLNLIELKTVGGVDYWLLRLLQRGRRRRRDLTIVILDILIGVIGVGRGQFGQELFGWLLSEGYAILAVEIAQLGGHSFGRLLLLSLLLGLGSRGHHGPVQVGGSRLRVDSIDGYAQQIAHGPTGKGRFARK